MANIAQLLNDLETKGHDVWIGGPASSDSIAKLESEMNISLPSSLSSFLMEYGAIGIYDNFLSGIIDDSPLSVDAGGIYGDTDTLRDDAPELPATFWVIKRHEDGAYCIDTARPTRNGEFGVVNFESGSVQHDKILVRNYNEFVCKWFLEPWLDIPA